jgi:hypothetical protein
VRCPTAEFAVANAGEINLGAYGGFGQLHCGRSFLLSLQNARTAALEIYPLPPPLFTAEQTGNADPSPPLDPETRRPDR